jgi:hypothetical protein
MPPSSNSAAPPAITSTPLELELVVSAGRGRLGWRRFGLSLSFGQFAERARAAERGKRRGRCAQRERQGRAYG